MRNNIETNRGIMLAGPPRGKSMTIDIVSSSNSTVLLQKLRLLNESLFRTARKYPV